MYWIRVISWTLYSNNEVFVGVEPKNSLVAIDLSIVVTRNMNDMSRRTLRLRENIELYVKFFEHNR